MKRKKGFTLIELLATLLILGALATVALSTFTDLSDGAELAQAQAVAGNLRSGAQAVRAVFIVEGHSTRTQNLAGYGNGNVDTNNIGYPIGIDKGNGNENIGRGNAGCVGVWTGVLAQAPSVAHNNNNQEYRSFRHDGNRVCSYVYRAGGDNGNQNTGELIIRYDSRNGSVRVCGARSDIPAC